MKGKHKTNREIKVPDSLIVAKPISITTSLSNFTIIPPPGRNLSTADGPGSLAGVSKFTNRVINENVDTMSVKNLQPGALTPGDRDKTMRTSTTSTAEQLQDAYDRTSKRLEHAVKRLKEKGLHKATVFDICKLSKGQDTNLATAITLIECLLSKPGHGGALWSHKNHDDITDEEYEKAIELVMFYNERATMYSTNLYGPLLEKHITKIYTAVLLIHYATYQRLLIDEQNETLEKLDAISYKYGGYEQALSLITSEIDEIQKDADQTLNKELEKVREDAAKKVEAAQNRVEELQQRIQPTEASLDAANTRIRKQLRELAQTKQKLADMEAALEHKNEKIAELIAMLPEPEDNLPNLPDNILIIGGHNNVIARLRQKYPNWRYIKGDDTSCADIKQPLCVFLMPVCLEHSVQHRALSMISPDTPVIKIKSTNLDRIEAEMKTTYMNIRRTGD